MDIQSAATTLRQQLITLQHSDRNVVILEKEVTSLGEQCLKTAMEDSLSRHLCLLLRLSITDGVHHTYQQYSANKWTQVQNTARSIKSALEPENEDLSMTSSSVVRQQPDKAADQWSSVFCEHTRHE